MKISLLLTTRLSILITFVFSGCSTKSHDSVARGVTSYALHNTEVRKTYFLAPHAKSNLQPGDPVTEAYFGPVHEMFSHIGYKKAADLTSADLLIIYQFTTDSPSRTVKSTKPIFDFDDGNYQTHSFVIPTASGLKTITGTSQSAPRMSFIGTKTIEKTVDFRRGLLILSAYPIPLAETPVRAWVTGSSIVTTEPVSSEELNRLLLEQMKQHIGKNNGQIDNVDAAGNPLSK